MTTGPLVSILMPVYNSFDFVRSEDQQLLPRALDAILAQTYQSFELIILDNQSTDRTAEVCKRYAEKDSRIRYILDTQKRYPEGGINQAATFKRGAYTMIANDDDLWASTYIERMVEYLSVHGDVDMCYSNGIFIDISGHSMGLINTSDDQLYPSHHDPISNFFRYHARRNPIPLAFGLFRSEVYDQVLPFHDFDGLKANVDNLFVAKFFLLGFRCGYVNEPLFSYRRKKRSLDPSRVPGMPGLERPVDIWLYYLNHQFNFYKAIENTHQSCSFTADQQRYLFAANMWSWLIFSSRIIYWIRDDLASGDSAQDRAVRAIARVTDQLVKKERSSFSETKGFIDSGSDAVHFHPAVIQEMLNSVARVLEGFVEAIQSQRAVIGTEGDPRLSELLFANLVDQQRDMGIAIDENQSSLKSGLSVLQPSTEDSEDAAQNPVVSIISASMNLGRFLSDTISSIRNQSAFSSLEHIVIDGGSTDGTLAVLQQHPHIKWISEPDKGYPDALRKGIRMARGKYVMQCAVSDALANEHWISRCIDLLDAHPEISLVWGFPERLSEDGCPGGVSYSQFHHAEAPIRVDMFRYWLRTGFFFPEGNLCVRKEVFEACYPGDDVLSRGDRLDWLEFSYAFHRRGYVSLNLPLVANFGRTHKDQMGETLKQDGKIWRMYRKYLRSVFWYRWAVILGLVKPIFINVKGEVILDGSFIRSDFIYEYLRYKIQNIYTIHPKYLSIASYKAFIKKKLTYYFERYKTV